MPGGVPVMFISTGEVFHFLDALCIHSKRARHRGVISELLACADYFAMSVVLVVYFDPSRGASNSIGIH